MKSVGRWTIAVALIAAVLGLVIYRMTLDTKDNSSNVIAVQVAPEALPSASPLPSLPALREVKLRSALADLCRNQTEKPGDEKRTVEDIQARLETFNQWKQDLSARLSVSSSAEHLHLTALLEDNPASRIELLERAVSRNPNDAFLLWRAVQVCSDQHAVTSCPLHDWERRLLMIDGQNSESWIRVAANRYGAGEIGAAIEAMRYASTAAESRSFFTETIEMTVRGFAAGSDYDFPERATMAFGLAVSQLPNYGDYITMCEVQSTRSVDWAYVCLAYGELVENQGKTVIGISVARSIQKLALEALGETDKLTAVVARQRSSQQERLNAISNNRAITDQLLSTNPTLFSAYLAAIRTHGEFGAREYLKNETSRLLQEQPELACDP